MSPRQRNRALTALTLVIVLLSTAAFAWTQAQKQEEVPITGIRLDRELRPGCECPRQAAELSFGLHRAQPVTATIVSGDGEPVRTLLDGALRESGRQTLSWEGTADDGDVVPDGEYQLRVELAVPDRTILIPNEIRVRAPGGG